MSDRIEKANYATGQQAGAPQRSLADACAARELTKTMLLAAAERMRREANKVEALAYAVEHISGDAEETLYSLLSQHVYRR